MDPLIADRWRVAARNVKALRVCPYDFIEKTLLLLFGLADKGVCLFRELTSELCPKTGFNLPTGSRAAGQRASPQFP